MSQWFVCVPGGDTVGPVSTSLLLLGIRSGKVPDDALVCRPGEPTWMGISEVGELAAALPGPDAFRGAEADSRYGVARLLGQGGMGEVYLCADEWIGREVAMKVAHKDQALQPHLRARFVREALVQGQLEHPSIVPVYDLGTRPDGALFFTMKRVHGRTLAEIVDGLRGGNPDMMRAYGRRRLLAAMSSVCLTVSYAHSRGVVHRDLKPDNVMLGDFGEVYVLDWGVAKVLEDAWAGRSTAAVGAPVGRTQSGVLIGTAGYASPEQVRGDAVVGPSSDVYALGAILFEVLAHDRLHGGGTSEALVASTLTAPTGRPSERAIGQLIPPELDVICARATAAESGGRFASAREMHDALERYLDGERDAERRHELSISHANSAAKALEAATRGGAGAEASRVRGMRELGAALALEPSNERAMRTLLAVLLEPAAVLPPEAEAELQAVEQKDRAAAAGNGVIAYSLLGLSTPLLLAMSIRRPWLLTLLVIVTVTTTLFMAWMWRSGKADVEKYRVLLPLCFLLVGLTSTIFGPFVMVPGTAAVTVAGFLVSTRANANVRAWLLVGGLASILVPAALQFAGITPRSYVFEPGGIRIVSNLVDFRPIPAMALLALGSCLTVVATVLSVGRSVEALVAAERRNFAQAWRLRQILPGGGDSGLRH
jgi:serine/threonine-protein kinase